MSPPIACRWMKRHFSPRFTAYATFNKNTPEEQLRIDEIRYPGGKMTGFILWHDEMYNQWLKNTLKNAPKPHGWTTIEWGRLLNTGNDLFDQWLVKQ